VGKDFPTRMLLEHWNGESPARLLRVQSQQLPTESQVLEDEVLTGTENADQPTEEMPERHDHSRNYIEMVRIELCAKSFILQVYDVLARHNLAHPARTQRRLNLIRT
jgi:hypothetical protein